MSLTDWMGTAKGQVRFEYSVIFLMLLLIAGMFTLGACDQTPSAKTDQSWVPMGSVNDGTGGATIYKKKDPENGKTVYVAIGVNSCSITVVDAK